MANLMKASNEWATRPADERYWNLDEMRERCFMYAQQAVDADADITELRAEARGDDIRLIGATGKESGFTHWSFGQACSLTRTPAAYLRSLPAEMAADLLTHGMHNRREGETSVKILFHQNGGLRARAFNSQRYDRIWNYQVIDALQPMLNDEWRVPPARVCNSDNPKARRATEADCLNDRHGFLSVKPGDMIEPSGLYASDKDCFIFMVNEDAAIQGPNGTHLSRGFFVENSEVGDRAFKLTTFLYNHVCGNHIVWGAQDVRRAKVIHIGSQAGEKAVRKMWDTLDAYSQRSAGHDERLIAESAERIIATTRQGVIDKVNSRKGLNVTQSDIGQAFDLAELHPEDGHNGPDTAWGMAQGLTRLSQTKANQDERTRLDGAAGKVATIDF